jgi:flagellar biosynthesis chaperone FliJ
MDFRDRVPMNRDQAMTIYLGEISNPRSAGEQDLRDAMGILGLSSADYHRDVNLQKQIVALNAEIAATEQAENDESARLTGLLRDCAQREAKAFETWTETKKEHATLMVQLAAATGRAVRLKDTRTKLLLAQRASQERLQQPTPGAHGGGMTFPAL